MKVSLVSTMLNEAKGLPEFLASLEGQRQAPDEWVVVDGGSTDDTLNLLRDFAARAPFPVRVLSEPGCNIAKGRNLAIRQAAFDLIAVTDAGCRLDAAWLQELVRPFEGEGEAEGAAAVAGWYEPDVRTPFERRVAMATFPRLDRLDPAAFLPSSRSLAFRREVWAQVGGYPEALRLAGEDTAFDLAILAAGHRFSFARGAVARWRPRGTWKSLLRQQYLYGFGDGEAGQNLQVAVRNGVKVILAVTMLAGMVVWPWIGGPLLVVVLGARFMQLGRAGWALRDMVPSLVLFPALWGPQALGYLAGLRHRRRTRPAHETE
ncbi:glycosyltransferase [Geothrix terrae]|uniref:glycosyltransferase n=1 Tax=Geothrix terrae TaxID=2922720 RepID=UPI001FAB7CCA|nr:glycosyltransferase [Geothrix terrae]